QATRRRRGRRAGLQLPAHAHARGPADRARVRQDQHPLARAGGPGGAHRRGGRDGEGAAHRHRLHPGRQRGARAGADRAPARAPPREPDRPFRLRDGGRRQRQRGVPGMSPRAEPEKITSIDAEYLSGKRFPYQEDRSLVEDIDLLEATPGEDINWLEDVTLLVEDGVPAVFDRYSNSFLKIYFDIPEGREDELARKVL